MEEQLQDDIAWSHTLDRDQHRIHEEYVSDDEYQDSAEDLPFGIYMTYEDGGPQYKIEEPYRAPWHKDKAIELLDESYEELLEYFTEESYVEQEEEEEEESERLRF